MEQAKYIINEEGQVVSELSLEACLEILSCYGYEILMEEKLAEVN